MTELVLPAWEFSKMICLCFDLNQLTLTSLLFAYLPINTASPKPQWTHLWFVFSELQLICSSQVNSFLGDNFKLASICLFFRSTLGIYLEKYKQNKKERKKKMED